MTNKLLILVVDDEPSIRELLQRRLRSRFDVRTGEGVSDALLKMGLEPPDVLITDLRMDEGGGRHLLSVVAAQFPDVVRVAYSAAARAELTALVECGAAHAAVAKSGDVSELPALLDRLFGSEHKTRSHQPGLAAVAAP